MRSLPESHWDARKAAHLLNRAGFGGLPNEIEAFVRLGCEASVAKLVDYESQSHPDLRPAFSTGAVHPDCPPDWAQPDPDRAKYFQLLRDADPDQRRELTRQARRVQSARILELRGWWLRRMVSGICPLQEKLTLFWHGHFATGFQKVRDAYLIWRQNQTFREHASGNWRAMLLAITRDPAMLLWLDQARSRRRHPNENYARELMELFTLGEGNYTEQDISEAARALTGITYNRISQESEYRSQLHDSGEKVVLGRTGELGYADVIDAILDQAQAARFIARKLWKFFAGHEPQEDLLDELAREFRDSGYEFKPLLRRIFTSGAFYSEKAIRQQIKSPVQLLVGTVRLLERPLPSDAFCSASLRLLGQDLFAPPNVKGWDGGVNWSPPAVF